MTGQSAAQSALWAVIEDATARLEAADVPSARHDAEQLAAFALGIDRSRLRSAAFFTTDQFTAFSEFVARRSAREPLQHIVGTAYFRHLELAVGPGVFVPRPETEVLVDAVLAAARRGATVVDLCSGSGAVALSVAHERPDTTVHAVELDEVAHQWLVRNAESTGVTVDIHLADAADALQELNGLVDVVASNPPYVTDGQTLQPEVAGFDPPRALWGGGDGLEVIRIVERSAARLLKLGGFLAIEHEETHGESAPALLRAAGWADVVDHQDLTGRPRFVTARKGT